MEKRMEKMANTSAQSVFDRLQSGEAVAFSDPQYGQIGAAASRTMALLSELNASPHMERVRSLWGNITHCPLDASSAVQVPVHINIGRFITIGKNVYVNHGCTFLDMGTITIEDDVLIGPKVSLITEGHPLKPDERKALTAKPVTIKRNAWIGAGAIVLPGVTIGENAVVAAGAVVSQNVPPNTVVAGVPARVIRELR